MNNSDQGIGIDLASSSCSLADGKQRFPIGTRLVCVRWDWNGSSILNYPNCLGNAFGGDAITMARITIVFYLCQQSFNIDALALWIEDSQKMNATLD